MSDDPRVYALLLDLRGDMGDLKGEIGGLRSEVAGNALAFRDHMASDAVYLGKIVARLDGLEKREARIGGWAAAVATGVSAVFAIGLTWIRGHGG